VSVRPNEPIPHGGESDLYRRVFDGLLNQAVRDRRLDEKQADVLRRRGHLLAGNLAIAWIRSETGKLSDAQLSAVLESEGLAGRDALDVQHALEFGYLLAPGADNWEFSHRTLAEWAAARALAHRVRAAAQRAERDHPPSHADLGELELRALAPFLTIEGRNVRPRWWQLLRFYAPEALVPLASVRHFLSRHLFERDSFDPVVEAFDTAFEFASMARWTDPDAARTAWGLFVRAAIFAADEEPHPSALLLQPTSERVNAFVERVGTHLPASLPALIGLASRTNPQAVRLRADPTLIAAFFPRDRLELFEPWLREGTPSQKLAVLRRYASAREAPPFDFVQRWSIELPRQFAALDLHSSARRDLQDAEAALYEAMLCSQANLPWPALRRRLLDWPRHLHGILTQWFCERSCSDSRAYGLQPEATHIELRKDALALLLADLVAQQATFVGQIQSAATDHEASRIASDLRRAIEREDNDPWPKFVTMARWVGWQVDRAGYSSSTERHPIAHGIEIAFRALDDRDRQLHMLFVALAQSCRLAEVAGRLWPLLSPSNPEREALLELLIEVRSIPSCINTDALLDHFSEENDLPYALRLDGTLDPSHEIRLREIAALGSGRARFLALLWCAHRDGCEAADALVLHLNAEDPELRRLVKQWLDSRPAHGPPRPQTQVPPAALESAPLAHRARASDPNWRCDLIAALETASASEEHELCALVRRYRMREALPILMLRFRAEPSSILAGAIGAIVEADDREVVDLLLTAEIPGGGIPSRVIDLLSLDNLPTLLARREAAHTFFSRRSVADSLSRFGSPAHSLLLAAYRTRAVEKREASPVARVWVNDLRNAVLRTLDVTTTPMESIVSLLFELLHGDRHDVYSSPGPLGSEFDEPADQDFCSQLRDETELRLAIEIVRRRLAEHPEEIDLAIRLLDHPSETFQIGVFEVFAGRVPAHEIAVMGLRALESHVRATDTRFEGETSALLLARIGSGGSGSVDVQEPRVGTDLAARVRAHLTGAHRSQLGALVQNTNAALRMLACRWIGELGTAEWAPLLAPGLADANACVVRTALKAWTDLDLPSLASALGNASRRRWGTRHYGAVLTWLAYRPKSWLDDLKQPVLRAVDELVTSTLVATLVGETLKVLSDWEEPPSALETLLDLLGEGHHTEVVTELSVAALQARAGRAGFELRAVLLRTLSRRGGHALPAGFEDQLSANSLDERITAAECLAIIGRADLSGQIEGVWSEAFREPSSQDAKAIRLRLARMLEQVSSVFCPLWLHLLDDLPYDWEGGLERAGLMLVGAAERCLERWGEEGLERLVMTMPHEQARWEPNSEACHRLVRVFGSSEVRRLLRAHAQCDPIFANLAKSFPLDQDERRSRILSFVESEILPTGWLNGLDEDQ
jgi:hypothetical protein